VHCQVLESLLTSDWSLSQPLPGDCVWLSTRHLRLRTESRKLTPRFIGPYEITARLNPVTYRLRLLSAMKVHPVFHVSQLKRRVTSPLAPPSPAGVGGSSIWWTGLVTVPEERSWVPSRFILDPSLISDFRRSRPGLSGAGLRGEGPVRHNCLPVPTHG
uniref:Tf2-1-like SH3-like domain-containing protein n=1 Tax=Oreochromis niloticus TaxID=8128 RepID=A0A669EY60_ORENI